MSASREEIARDLVVAALSGRDYVEANEVAEMYTIVLKAVKKAAGIPSS